MKSDRENILLTGLTCLVILCLFAALRLGQAREGGEMETVVVGFIYEGDESTPYTANFKRAADELRDKYGDQITILERFNVSESAPQEALTELVEEGCGIIFANSYGYGVYMKEMAAKYPKVQFCQATCSDANVEPVLDNYHNFMGEICEGRYVEGLVAGRKLRELIDEGRITEEEAWIGYVGAYPYAEVISGYTAFFLGVREECPSARMRLRYTNTWTNYNLEKDAAEKLIEEGCVIISQHSDTVGPAVACEDARLSHPVYHVGYNQDMISVAPTTSLTGCRINWSPYVSSAVEAMLRDVPIEKNVKGHKNGLDVGGGFDEGWVEMLELNHIIAPEGCEELINEAVEAFMRGTVHIYQGEYTGTDPFDPSDTIDLRTEYKENSTGSAPSFHYVLDDVIIVEED
ncbi:MAG: BMP family ABC transporter substrate-binding protein [Lachnospiraceae bacterium]|nr:BMP family ABC transporter substrate-binding protein [Lachnospiraceae bacterium]